MNGVLIVDDEADIREILAYNLQKHGFTVFLAENGAEGLAELERNREAIDLVLLDMMMPIMDGFELCKIIREKPEMDALIICFLTARNEEYNQINALNVGADDYIAKPITPNMLVTKVKSLLRRKTRSTEVKENQRLVIDPEKYMVIFEGEALQLTKKEFEILALLHAKPGVVFTRSQILAEIWGDGVIVGDRTVDVHIRKLREKLSDQIIQTVKGIGYKLVD